MKVNGSTMAALWATWHHLQYLKDMKGEVSATYEGNLFLSFYGINYAYDPWIFKDPNYQVRYTSANRKVDCLEIDRSNNREIGQENCLCINVFTPVPYVNRSMPVLVWIQGEAFPIGNNKGSVYYPARLMDYGIVVVTMSYRLGPLGFASFEDEILPGNYGLKDQRLAIEWVLENIHEFGGDPHRVTLAGEGAGASYELFHLNGYFRYRVKRGIALSGSRFAPWALSRDRWVRNRTVELYYELGCYNVDHMSLYINCIGLANVAQIDFRARQKISFWWKNTKRSYIPVIDGDTIKSDPWLDRSKGKFTLLIGLRKDEGDIGRYLSGKYDWGKDMFWKFFCLYDTYIPGKRGKCDDFYLWKNLESLYSPDVDSVQSVAELTADEWFLFPAIVETKHHGGPLIGFMYDYKTFPLTKCTKYKGPFMDLIDGCPPLDRANRALAGKLAKLIATFVHEKKIDLPTYPYDRDVFNITEALYNPEAFAVIDESMSRRMKTWKTFLLSKHT